MLLVSCMFGGDRAKAPLVLLTCFVCICICGFVPEAVDGGPIAFVNTGDRVRIDVKNRKLDLLVDDAELANRKKDFKPLSHKYKHGVLAKYTKVVGSASQGAVCC